MGGDYEQDIEKLNIELGIEKNYIMNLAQKSITKINQINKSLLPIFLRSDLKI